MWNVSLPLVEPLLHPPVQSLASRRRQLATAQMALYALTELPEGDLVETGVYHGGTTVLMARLLQRVSSARPLWACDSFQGLPRSQSEDAGGCIALSRQLDGVPRRNCGRGRAGQFAAPRTTVERALRAERLEHRVRIVPGWFHESLPPAGLRSIGFLRMDGDTYNGTYEALRRLYPLVVVGGMVYVDDAGSFRGAAQALQTYFGGAIGTPIREAEGYYDAVWFRKESSTRLSRLPHSRYNTYALRSSREPRGQQRAAPHERKAGQI